MKTQRTLDRFMAKVDVQPGGCWLWFGAISAKGYGRFMLDGRNRLAHRVAFEIFVGPIPAGLTIDHTCEDRACVNPEHLEPVTNRENLERGFWPATAFKTRCSQGHRLELVANGSRRICRICDRASQRRYRQRLRDAGRIGLPSAAKTHCPRGHVYDELNTYRTPGSGHRLCRTCRTERQRLRRAGLSIR